MDEYTLTPQALKRILSYAKARIQDFKQARTRYMLKIVELEALPCFKCEKIIEVGSKYSATHKSTTAYTGRKYYHPPCLERLYHE